MGGLLVGTTLAASFRGGVVAAGPMLRVGDGAGEGVPISRRAGAPDDTMVLPTDKLLADLTTERFR